ncbi:SNF2-related protein [Anaerovibrio lipolyticus]|uniref:SNF2-related protein n=1 Tax=Anaerovibrio lipolyticus TaxID=82374 RepID=UPI0026EA6D5E|nr:SNF2-related protein [Anaerovibrio lipolyticus]MBE6105283.1 DEAD/DEAH box helicase [Anaerovibrio lipolyticus]
MEFKPHGYQQYAIDFVENNEISCLLLDMGLGKTAITLTALKDLLGKGIVKRVLVIAPLRVARDTWSAEIKKWDHIRGLRHTVAVGSTKERLAAINDSSAQIVIINRENVDWLVKHCDWNFDMVVIDELSSFKNHAA